MIHVITGSAGTGKTLKMFEQIILAARLHGKQSLVFTEDRIYHREDIQRLINKQAVPDLMICEMSQSDFLYYVENSMINPVIQTSRTVRIGVDYSNLSPRIVAACHKLSELGYEVYATCQVMRSGAPQETNFEKLFK